MTKQKTPLQIVNEEHGGKEKLVAKLTGLLQAEDGEEKDEHRARLLRVSNAKLLHLLSVGERAKELGGKDAIVKKIAEFKGQAKDHEFSDALGRKSLGTLIDLHDSVSRRAAGKAKKTTPRRARKRRNRYT